MRRSYAKAREEDILATCALIPPQVNRAVAGTQQAGGELAARQGGRQRHRRPRRPDARHHRALADEMLLFPSTVRRGTPEDRPYSYAFAIAVQTPGLRHIAREPLDHDRPTHDHPLFSRFEESDCVVVFDNVYLPYGRVFALGDAELCNGFYARTNSVHHMTHQVVTRTIPRTECLLGLVPLPVEAIGIEQFQHVQEDIAGVIVTVELLRASLRAAEAGAEVNEYGVLTPAFAPVTAARNLCPKLYRRFPQVLRKLGAWGLMATPTESDINGPGRRRHRGAPPPRP
ncbi:4-hydroxyphenylacetate 3-hydroxylase C-terminal domain-containing protein [Streptomyces sediminimaris]|uniref:4-hydroxyphenylacetate 3-hydroxylase C-terminal domain-containing protein n=1 Tax=Streptomyces sediminimaris TaxID=3383721 RepID=UPI00399A9437